MLHDMSFERKIEVFERMVGAIVSEEEINLGLTIRRPTNHRLKALYLFRWKTSCEDCFLHFHVFDSIKKISQNKTIFDK